MTCYRGIVGISDLIITRSYILISFNFQMLELLEMYVEVTMTKLCPKHGRVEELEEYFQVNLCIHNKQTGSSCHLQVRESLTCLIMQCQG